MATTTKTRKTHINHDVIYTAIGGAVTNLPRSTTVTSSVFTGISSPGYKKAIKNSQNATTPANATFRRVDQIGGYTTRWTRYANGTYKNSTVFGYYADPSFGNPGTVSAQQIVSATQNALSNFHKRVYNARTALSAGTFVGELKETIAMLRNPANALRSSISSYFSHVRKHAKYKQSKANAQMIRDTYLEYTFGWKPLIHDIQDGFEAAARMQEKRQRQAVHASGFNDDRADSNTSYAGDSYAGPMLTTVKNMYKATENLGAAIDFSVNSPQVNAKNQLGLSSLDIVPTMWQLIPYSFVADYFTNVDAMTQAISNVGMGYVYSYYVRKSIASTSVIAVPVPGADMTAGQKMCMTTTTTYTRGIATFPMPSFTFTLPSAHQSLNIGALISQGRSTEGYVQRQSRSSRR